MAEIEDTGSANDEAYLGDGVHSAAMTIADGTLVIIRHEDGMRTLSVETLHDEVRRRVSLACRDAHGRWLPQGRAWLLDLDKTKVVVETLGARPAMPSSEGPSIMSRVDSQREIIYDFKTDVGVVRAMQLQEKNWALRSQGNDEVAALITETCRHHGVGEWYEPRSNWLIPQEPRELIEQVARAIRERGRRDDTD